MKDEELYNKWKHFRENIYRPKSKSRKPQDIVKKWLEKLASATAFIDKFLKAPPEYRWIRQQEKDYENGTGIVSKNPELRKKWEHFCENTLKKIEMSKRKTGEMVGKKTVIPLRNMSPSSEDDERTDTDDDSGGRGGGGTGSIKVHSTPRVGRRSYPIEATSASSEGGTCSAATEVRSSHGQYFWGQRRREPPVGDPIGHLSSLGRGVSESSGTGNLDSSPKDDSKSGGSGPPEGPRDSTGCDEPKGAGSSAKEDGIGSDDLDDDTPYDYSGDIDGVVPKEIKKSILTYTKTPSTI